MTDGAGDGSERAGSGPRLFTVEEANALLPDLIPILEDLRAQKAALDEVRLALTRLTPAMRGNGHGAAAIDLELRVRDLLAADAAELGLVTSTPDDIDWEDEIRLVIEERASFSPDALTGMEANLRFAGRETPETKVFGRLTAWQNWIFQRPNAAGPEGALRRYGTGQRADYDRKRV